MSVVAVILTLVVLLLSAVLLLCYRSVLLPNMPKMVILVVGVTVQFIVWMLREVAVHAIKVLIKGPVEGPRDSIVVSDRLLVPCNSQDSHARQSSCNLYRFLHTLL